MPTTSLDLESPDDLNTLKAHWKFGPGWIPGEPNEGLVSQAAESPARLADYDDSAWEVISDVEPRGPDSSEGGLDDQGLRKRRSTGFTFGWYRITITLPESVGDMDVAGASVWFETNIDDYGEVWVDGEWDRTAGAIRGFNVTNRVLVTDNARSGATHTVACLAVNGPLARPGGGIFVPPADGPLCAAVATTATGDSRRFPNRGRGPLPRRRRNPRIARPVSQCAADRRPCDTARPMAGSRGGPRAVRHHSNRRGRFSVVPVSRSAARRRIRPASAGDTCQCRSGNRPVDVARSTR